MGGARARHRYAVLAIGAECEISRLEPSNAGPVALRGQLDEAGLNSPAALLRVTRAAPRRFAWTKDTRDPGHHFIRQTIAGETAPAPGKISFVLDGSGGLRPHWNSILESLEKIPADTKTTILVASDKVETPAGPAELAALKPTGGQDNLPALLEAWNLAVREPGSVIVWIHGPQPVRLQSEPALLQAIERTAAPPAIYEIQTEPGPDQIVTQLDGVRSLHCMLRTGELSADVGRVLAQLRGTAKSWQIRRAQVASQSDAEADGAMEGSELLPQWKSLDALSSFVLSNFVAYATKFDGVVCASGPSVFLRSRIAPHGVRSSEAHSISPGFGRMTPSPGCGPNANRMKPPSKRACINSSPRSAARWSWKPSSNTYRPDSRPLIRRPCRPFLNRERGRSWRWAGVPFGWRGGAPHSQNLRPKSIKVALRRNGTGGLPRGGGD